MFFNIFSYKILDFNTDLHWFPW